MENITKIKDAVLEELNLDWVSAIEVVGIINREIGVSPVDMVTPKTLDIVERLIKMEALVPGSFDSDFRFVPWGNTVGEYCERIKTEIKVGERITTDTIRWFDLPGRESHQSLADRKTKTGNQ